jgi:putative acetyltransferase
MIREFNPSDTQQVLDLWYDSVIIAHNFIPAYYWEMAREKVEKEYLGISKTWVYEENGKIRGFISIISGDTIGALFVAPEDQNKGIGSELIEYVKEKYSFLVLSVYRKNKKAISFYEENGFVYEYEQTDLNTQETEEVYTYSKGE